MTGWHWVLLTVFLVAWLGIGAAVLWSVVALLRGEPTTCHYILQVGRPLAVFLISSTTFAVGFLAGHLLWPLSE